MVATSFVSITALVGCLLDLDPLSVIMNYFEKFAFEIKSYYVQKLWSVGLSKVFRSMLFVGICQRLWINIRTLMIVAVTLGTSFVGIEKVLMEVPVVYSRILLYKQLIVIKNVIYSYEKAGIAATLASGSVLFTVSVSTVQLGFYLGNPLVIVICFGGIVLTSGSLVVALNVCGAIYYNSVLIKAAWKSQSGSCSRLDGAYISRLVKSCRMLYVPAGEMGRVDKEMKLHYFEAIMVNTANTSIAIKHFVQ